MADWHTRYRRIIDAYRGKLLEVSPRACDEIDDKLYAMGEKWVADQREVDLDAFMTAREIAERFGFEVYHVRSWARRHPDLIPVYRDGHKVRYRLRDVLKYKGNA